MATFTFVAQDVNSGLLAGSGKINIVNGSTSTLSFSDIDDQLGAPQSGETVSVDGGPPQTYTMLGTGDVRGDDQQYAAFIQLEDGTTFAIDLDADEDQIPNLQTGNTGLTVDDLDPSDMPAFPYLPDPVCFGVGTNIRTPLGSVEIENLRIGDQVVTADNGTQTIRFIQRQHFVFRKREDKNRPIVFKAGSLGAGLPRRDLVVSPQHRMLLPSKGVPNAESSSGVFYPAKSLTDMPGVRVKRGVKFVDYFHLLLDRHEVIFAEGLPTESLFPGPMALQNMKSAGNNVSEKALNMQWNLKTARPVLSVKEAQRLAFRKGKQILWQQVSSVIPLKRTPRVLVD